MAEKKLSVNTVIRPFPKIQCWDPNGFREKVQPLPNCFQPRTNPHFVSQSLEQLQPLLQKGLLPFGLEKKR